MSSEPILKVTDLDKTFRIFKRPSDRLRQIFTSRPLHKKLHAVKAASFTLERGESMGIIGENGSGKSTLLKLIAGVLVPDSGHIESRGAVAGLLELGTGFNGELSGRKNIYLNGVYLGMDHESLAAREEAIIDFAELGEFIDTPLKNYSSGMTMRLAFAIAIHSSPACFLIDEALSVGDVRFQQKCYGRLEEYLAQGGSILFVSHDLNAVKLFCDKALVLEHGETRYLGDPEEAVNIYNEILSGKGNSGQNTKIGYGNGALQFTSVEVLNSQGAKAEVLTSGESMEIRFAWESRETLEDVTFGFLIRNRFGQDVFGTNGKHLKKLAHVEGKGSASFVIEGINLTTGIYTINLAAHSGGTHLDDCYHWWDAAASFWIAHDPDYYFEGYTRLNARLELK